MGLIVGGNGPDTVSAELYNPAVGTFAATGAMIVDRSNHAATLLRNGKVLIAGGFHPPKQVAGVIGSQVPPAFSQSLWPVVWPPDRAAA
ncbi:MAG: hypothetical protein WCG85_27270 [Polyangia bacterium]